MVAVNTMDGIKYGFRIMLYFTAVVIIGAVIMSIGGGVMADAQGGIYGETNTGQLLIGFVLSAGGFLTLYAGFMGALYKVIADAVESGNRAAS